MPASWTCSDDLRTRDFHILELAEANGQISGVLDIYLCCEYMYYILLFVYDRVVTAADAAAHS
jgi:hypothetical protein